ncbi:MAG: hypothetical protein P4L82_16310, partial [Ancalomicrobiaceae bacterium]|nr:hypothetical protein [Ancalomicrobiaceae bacterium]
MTSDGQIAAAIEALRPGRPLVVVDVDEVVCQFIGPLSAFLQLSGYWLDATSYGLTGNIKRAGTALAVPKTQVAELIQAFFDAEIGRQPLVPGAAAALARLATHAGIVLLTNAPHRLRQARLDNLARQGIEAPLITNDGQKGPVLAELAAAAGRPVAFIDDSPRNLASAAASLPDAVLVQFIADPTFLALAPAVPG